MLCPRLFKPLLVLVQAILESVSGHGLDLAGLLLLGVELVQNILTSLEQFLAFLLLVDSVVQTLLSYHVVPDLLAAQPDVARVALALDLEGLLDLR